MEVRTTYTPSDQSVASTLYSPPITSNLIVAASVTLIIISSFKGILQLVGLCRSIHPSKLAPYPEPSTLLHRIPSFFFDMEVSSAPTFMEFFAGFRSSFSSDMAARCCASQTYTRLLDLDKSVKGPDLMLEEAINYYFTASNTQFSTPLRRTALDELFAPFHHFRDPLSPQMFSMDPETEFATNQGTLCLDSMANTPGYERNLPSSHGFQCYGLLSPWPDSPWGYCGQENICNDSDCLSANNPPNTETIESPFLSTFYEWFPSTYPNEENDITELLTPQFLQDSTSQTSYLPSFGSMSPALLSSESSASSSSGTQSVETNTTTPCQPCSPDMSPPKDDNKTSKPKNQPKTSKKKRAGKKASTSKRERNKVEKPYKCTKCTHTTAEERDLKRHLEVHSRNEAKLLGLPEEKMKCKYYPICRTTFVRKDYIKRHLRSKHGGL